MLRNIMAPSTGLVIGLIAAAAVAVIAVIVIIVVAVKKSKEKKLKEQQEKEAAQKAVAEEQAKSAKKTASAKTSGRTAAKKSAADEKPVEYTPTVKKSTVAKVGIPPAIDTAKQVTKTYHVSKRTEDGKWQVKAAGATKAIKLFALQTEAIDYAKTLAANQNARIVIHKEDGSFRRLTYGGTKS